MQTFGCKDCGMKWVELNDMVAEELQCPRCQSYHVDEVVASDCLEAGINLLP